MPPPSEGGDRVSASPVRARSLPLGTSARSGSALALAQQPPAHAVPLCATAGAPAVVAAETLADRVHVVTQDASGELVVWNVLTGEVASRSRDGTLEEKVRQLQPAMYTPQWFTTKVNTGVRAH